MSPFGGDNSGGMDAGPGAGGGYPVAPPPDQDPRAARGDKAVASMVASARQLSMMFPQVNEEVRTILNIMPKIQAKLAASKPAPEPAAPPV